MLRWVSFGALLGLAWSAALRAYMVELAGPATRVEVVGTFVLILLPGVVVGGLLGAAEGWRRSRTRPRGWRWTAAAPLLFAVAALAPPGALVTFLTTGIGGGAIGVVAFGMVSGYAISGRGPLWARIVCGVLGVALGAGSVVGGVFVNPELSFDTARGWWVAVLIASLLAVFALACAIPHRPIVVRAAASVT